MAALTVRVPSPGPEVSPFKDRVWQTPASAADKDSPRWVKPSASGDAATPQMAPSPPATPGGTGSARKKKGRRVRRPRSAASPASSPWLAHRVHRPSSASGGRSARRSVGKSGPRSPTTRSVRQQPPLAAACSRRWALALAAQRSRPARLATGGGGALAAEGGGRGPAVLLGDVRGRRPRDGPAAAAHLPRAAAVRATAA